MTPLSPFLIDRLITSPAYCTVVWEIRHDSKLVSFCLFIQMRFTAPTQFAIVADLHLSLSQVSKPGSLFYLSLSLSLKAVFFLD
jgi:hypothetical protein